MRKVLRENKAEGLSLLWIYGARLTALPSFSPSPLNPLPAVMPLLICLVSLYWAPTVCELSSLEACSVGDDGGVVMVRHR